MSEEINDEEPFSLEPNEEDENYCKFRQSIDSMVSRRAKKYKNYSHPCLQKSADDSLVRGADSTLPQSSPGAVERSVSCDRAADEQSADRTSDDPESSTSAAMEPPIGKATKDAAKETSKGEYRVIHRPPLPPSTSSKLMHAGKQPNQFASSEFQVKAPNFNDIIDTILSSNANIREYLRELRKNSELDYLLLSKILEKTLVPKANVYVQTDREPAKSVRSVETNTLSPSVSQKQTQTRESRILSYKLLETENLFEKLKIQSNFAGSNYEIKRTSDLKLEEDSADGETDVYSNKREKHCSGCNQHGLHETSKNRTLKIEDKYTANRDRIHLWNNLLQVDNTSEFSEDNSNATNQSSKQETTASENQSSTLSDDDQFSVSTRKSKKSYSSIKSTKSVKSTKSIRSIKDELLGERESDLIERYKRIKDCKLKYECEKREFIELRKQFKNLKKKLAGEQKRASSPKARRTIEFDDYHQPIASSESYRKERSTFKEQIREQKRISFNEDDQPKGQSRFECEEQFDLPVYETSVADESEATTAFEGAKDEDDDDSYLTDSEYSVLDNHLIGQRPDGRANRTDPTKTVEFVDQQGSELENAAKNSLHQNSLHQNSLHQNITNVNSINQQGAVKTESKILIETTNLKKKEISEISSQTELTQDGTLSRRTQVTNTKKVPVLVPIDSLQYADSSQFSSPTPFEDRSHHQQQYNTKTPEPIISSPTSTAAATPSTTPARKSRKKHRSSTVEIHSVTPSTANCSRPNSAIDLNAEAEEAHVNARDHYANTASTKLPNQPKGKFFTNSYSEGELNAMKKDKHCILSEQLNFGISEPFMAYDSAIYEDNKQAKKSKIYSENQMPSAKALRMSLQRNPSKRLLEGSNLQQIVEWQETNSSTITNEINSEPFKRLDGNSQAAKTVSLTTETTLQNKGNERTIETKSKAVRKFDVHKDPEKENQSNRQTTDDGGNRSASASSNTSPSKAPHQPRRPEQEEETSFNPPPSPHKSTSSSRCNKCEQKKSSSKSSRSKRESEQERRPRTSSRNYEQTVSKERYREEEQQYGERKKSRSVCVRNVNCDYEYVLPDTMFHPLADYQRFPGDTCLKNYIVDTTETTENEKSNQDNLSKLSFDSGHSSSMSSISYQNKLNSHHPIGHESTIQESNLDDLNDLADEESEIRIDPVDNSNHSNHSNDDELSDGNLEERDQYSLVKPSIDEFSKSLVPQVRSSNLRRNTEIINRITKTVYPESINEKKVKKKKFVFEQQLNSPSTDQEQNDCRISSLITMEIPCDLRKKSRCSKCHKNRKMSVSKLPAETAGDFEDSTSFNGPEIEADRCTATSLSSACSSETDSLFNEEDLNTLTKFQKFKPVLIDQNDEQTTWEYSLECCCFNGVNASVKTTVTQFHQKNKAAAFLDGFPSDQPI